MGPQLEKVRKELATHRIFLGLCQRLVEVNEQICQLRPVQEVKLGCVFTQTEFDDHQRPVRDEHGTTYVGAIESAEAFGTRIYGEAIRRGMTRAAKVIVLGDGARWIWGIAEEHFYGAIQIVDLYHAREHVALIAQLVYGTGTIKSKEWMEARREQLDAGDVEAVIAWLPRLRP